MLLQKEGARCDPCTCYCDRLGLGLTVTAGGRFSSLVLLSSLLSAQPSLSLWRVLQRATWVIYAFNILPYASSFVWALSLPMVTGRRTT